MPKEQPSQADRRTTWSEQHLKWYKLTAKNTANFRVHNQHLKKALEKWDAPKNKDTEATKLYKLLTLKRYEKITEKQTLIKYLPSLIRNGSSDQEAVLASLNALFDNLLSFMGDLYAMGECVRLEEKWDELDWRDYELEAKIEGSRDLRLLQGLIRRHGGQMSLFPQDEEDISEED